MRIPKIYFEKAEAQVGDRWNNSETFLKQNPSPDPNETPQLIFMYNQITRLRAAVLYLADQAGLNGEHPELIEGDPKEV